MWVSSSVFLSTLSLRRATSRSTGFCVGWIISIHALLAESDTSPCVVMNVRRDFYPRSPCGERPAATVRSTHSRQFLSTLSLRRATRWQKPLTASPTISIHALLAESDDAAQVGTITEAVFLSTLSLRRATMGSCYAAGGIGVFLSTLSLRRATCTFRLLSLLSMIFLSTLSLRRATRLLDRRSPRRSNFYPRSPCGERRANNQPEQQEQRISIHALLAESDLIS